MKVSWNWLGQFVNLDGVTPAEVADKLTFAGIEVESIETMAKATSLVIGEILSCEKHPDSDHLHVLQVNEGGKYGIHQIVCGAPNARKGLKVIVAREGAVLPLVTIAKSDIRGQESDGMCCALYELGVDKKYLSEKQCAGIEELPLDAKVGEEEVLHYLGLDDAVLDLKLLANRPDLNAMENVALEVGALLDRPVKIPSYSVKKKEASSFKVGSETPNCSAFAARLVKGLKVGPSPKWLRDILTSEGVRSIDNVVDIGNFVMLLTGQPLNMYDLDQLPAQELVVRNDYEGDFLAMDEKTYKLIKGDLVVTSNGRPMCLAGIMTSKECAVNEATKNVVIEAALFNGAAIRHTSNRLGLASESSSRFVKGLNPSQAERVLEIASSLLLELASASSVSETKSYDTVKHDEKTIVTSLSYINKRLGTSFSKEEVLAILKRDHLDTVNPKGDELLVHVPAYRIDMNEGCDVSEEVIRLLGFDHVVSKLPVVDAHYQGLSEEQSLKVAVRRYLREQGLDEILTYTLVNAKQKDQFAYLNHGECYKLLNPMTDDRAFVRQNMLPSLLEAASYNAARQIKDLAFFEVSDIDTPAYKGRHLSFVLVGEERQQGLLKKKSYDFYDAKGLFLGIMGLLGLNENRYRLERLESDKLEFHPGRSAAIYIGKTLVGVMGELHPTALAEYGLSKGAVAFEMDLGAFLTMKTSPEKATVPARFPFVQRDLAFTIDQKVAYEDIRREIARTDKLVTKVEIFDLYQGANIAADKKSVALTITIQNPDKTLTDPEVVAVMEKVIGTLKMRFNAEVRQ
jgi:phenylalanyl-tRNA synthetase beta chain